jgi:hypothetical protein
VPGRGLKVRAERQQLTLTWAFGPDVAGRGK